MRNPLLHLALIASTSFLVTAHANAAASLVLTSPLDYQVFQRRTEIEGPVHVRGKAVGDAASLRVRITGTPLRGELDTRWQEVPIDGETREFRRVFLVPAGGWYRVEIQLGETVTTAEHVGVGEVFVVAGQSNSTNYGEQKLRPASGLVSTFSGEVWRVADDPQPGVHDGSGGGSFIPPFGDALAEKYRVPIGVASVGHGGTSVRQWLPEGATMDSEPTAAGYYRKTGEHEWTSDGTLFNHMLARIEQLGPGGFRAVLWHQGESDAHQQPGHGIAPETYTRMMRLLVSETKKQAGWNFPFLVALATYHVPGDESAPEIREAQKALWDGKTIFEGPDTDTLTGDHRDSGGKGVHLSAKGQIAHGKLWAEKVGAFLDKAPAEKR
jgi:hypothetical protein